MPSPVEVPENFIILPQLRVPTALHLDCNPPLQSAKLSLFVSSRLLFPSSSSIYLPAAGSAFKFHAGAGLLWIDHHANFKQTTPSFRTYASKRRMGPKKEVKPEKILLGRPGNNLKSGIVCTA